MSSGPDVAWIDTIDVCHLRCPTCIRGVGGLLQYVTRNLAAVREIIIRRALALQVDLRFLRFDYNGHQENQLRDYAQSMGFQFEVLDGVGHPKWNWLKDYNNERYVREAE